MVNVTVSITKETKELMQGHPDINWSAVVRQAIEEKTARLLWKEQMLHRLNKEEAFNEWAVRTVRASREHAGS